MTITISTEGGNTLANWSVYSSSVERLVIPRIGETVRIDGEYFVVVDVTYDIPYSLGCLGFSIEQVRIRVKKKEENEKTKYE